MKKLVLILLLLSAFVLSAEWIELNVEAEMFDSRSLGLSTTEVEFTLPGYEREIVSESGIDYDKISYFNEGEILEVGKPDLPCFRPRTRLLGRLHRRAYPALLGRIFGEAGRRSGA